MSASSQLYSSSDFVAFPVIAADANLSSLDPQGRKRLSRRILAQNGASGAAASIVLQRGDGVNITCVIYGGQSLEVQASKIIAAGTTATNVVVHW